MKSIKKIFFLLLLLVQCSIYAQFNSIDIGVDGLTCSACTRSVEMSIRKLGFVDSVIMNLDNTDGKITFKKGAKVEVDKIAKAVVDAGFSVRSLKADMDMANLSVSKDYCWINGNDTYHFIKVEHEKELTGDMVLLFVGKNYMSPKEFKKWKTLCTNNCSSSAAQPGSHFKNYYVAVL